jgi:hypothetical protein
VTKKTNIIEINGKRYDALTGTVIVDSPATQPSKGTVDGIINRKDQSPKPEQKPLKSSAKSRTLTSVVTQPVMDIARSRTVHSKSAHSPEPAKTLMRSAVHKPNPALKRTIKTQSATDGTKALQPTATIQRKLSSKRIDPEKQQHANVTPKSKLVSRFVRGQAAELTMQASVPSPAVAAHQKRVAMQQARTDMPTPAKQPSLAIFERAMHAATSHEQPYAIPEKQSSRYSSRLKVIAAGSVAVIVIGGFLAYQNLSSINLYLASSRAGFSASMPSYRPSGFDLSALTSSSGAVGVTFKSNSDQRDFTLTEKPSSWDSPTLRDAYVVYVAGSNYQTIESAGRTIYFYGDHNATWVNGGIWYQLQSQGALSDQQLIEIATSV